MKNIYVLWSGGLDSTYLIQYLLEQDPTCKVHAGYTKITNNPDNRLNAEQNAIKEMAPIFEKKYGDRFNLRGVVAEIGTWGGHFFPLGQLHVWLASIILTTEYDYDQIAIGYVMGDMGTSWINELTEVVDSLSKLTYHDSPRKFPKLIFPLRQNHKGNIWDALNEDLKPHVMWCEFPKDETLTPCMECDSCKRHQQDVVRYMSATDLVDYQKRLEERNKEEIKVPWGCKT